MTEAEKLREDWEERASIMEFEGNMSREEAERAAWERVYRPAIENGDRG